MEWMLTNWDIVFSALFGLFYVAEKIVKQSKQTSWNDILIDGLKWLAGKKPPGKCAILLLIFLMGCASVPIPERCRDSILVTHEQYYKFGSLVVKVGNTQAIRSNLYTKEQAIKVLEEIEVMLKNSSTTYMEFGSFVLSKISAVNERAGVEVFIIADFLVDMKENPSPIHPCDAELLLKDVQKLKLYTQMS